MPKRTLIALIFLIVFVGGVSISIVLKNTEISRLNAVTNSKESRYVNTRYGFSFVSPVGWRISNELSSFFVSLNSVQINSKFSTENLDDAKSNVEFTSRINEEILKWKPEISSTLYLTNRSEKETLDYANSVRKDITNINKANIDIDENTIFVQAMSGGGTFKATSTNSLIMKYVTLKNGITAEYMKKINFSTNGSLSTLAIPLKKQVLLSNGKLASKVFIMVPKNNISEKQLLDFANTFQISE
jgi:hypothetical protein